MKMAGSHPRNYCIIHPFCNSGEKDTIHYFRLREKKDKSLWIQHLLPEHQKCFLYSRNEPFKAHTEFFVKLKKFNQLPTSFLFTFAKLEVKERL